MNFHPQKLLFVFSKQWKGYLIKLIKNRIFFYNSHNGLHITNPICHNRTIVTIEGTLQKRDSIIDATNKNKSKGSSEGTVSLFSTVTSAENLFYLHLLIGWTSLKMAEDSEKNYYCFERGNDNKIIIWQNLYENPNKTKKIFENFDFRGLILTFAAWKKFVVTEALAQRCSVKMVFLEVSQSSQEKGLQLH